MTEEDPKKIYEVGYLLLNPDKNSRIKEVIKESGGEIIEDRDLKEARLAYPIEKHESAYLGSIDFKAGPEAPLSVDKALKLEEQVLRFIILMRPVDKPEKKEGAFDKGDRKSKTSVVPQPRTTTAVTNEALEEKLEEILK
jgi:small subunit ribosomal protein S6